MESVAVYSEADRDALHVELADFACPIGGASPTQSYLVVDNILEAARRSGADALHPGYGFLSENALFAEAVQAAGQTWVGPSPACMRAMGDKLSARGVAARAGLPVLPGAHLSAARLDDIAAAADEVGFPLLLKAAGGGGGIGMQRIESPAQLSVAVPKLIALAERAFGVGTVYLERFVARARHIEVQIFGDGAGRAIHLFERDCSLQRRYQKIIEESPAPDLDPAVRRDLCRAAVSLAEHQRYLGAGTVEFLLDAETGAFFFLEMNTRIQVEHGVTEMVTGADLVAMQLTCSTPGWRLPNQEEMRSQGHAIECRLYAEDPARGFRPCPGRLESLEFPAGEGLRIDTGYRGGDLVTPFYDPLIAKIIAHGDTREAALRRMTDALRRTRAEGIVTNQRFLETLVTSRGFIAGEVDTGLAEHMAEGLVRTDANSSRPSAAEPREPQQCR